MVERTDPRRPGSYYAPVRRRARTPGSRCGERARQPREARAMDNSDDWRERKE
jgi:hypothetical protein